MKVGDLVRYEHISANSQVGLVVGECGEDGDKYFKYLIQWSGGRKWFVAEDWVEVLNESR